jgi:tripartite ATP-independent transporter DctP family solute receptor
MLHPVADGGNGTSRKGGRHMNSTIKAAAFGILGGLALTLATLTQAHAQRVTLRFAHNLSPTEPFHLAAERFAENVRNASNGDIRVTVFPSEQLGPNKEILQLVQQGANVITLTDAGYMGDFVPDFGILQAPYLVGNPADFSRILASSFYKELVSKSRERGLMPLAFNWYIGSRNVISNREIKSLEDFRGLSIRVPPIPMYQKTFEALGARPVTLQWSEVYTGLSQGVVDAAEAPLPTIFGTRLYEVRKNVTMTRHFAAFLGIIINARFLDQLSDSHRSILLNEAQASGEWLFKATLEKEASVSADLQKQGVKIVDVSNVEAFQKATAPVYSGFTSWTPGLLERVRGILAGS